jgi:hypothetical protein
MEPTITRDGRVWHLMPFSEAAKSLNIGEKLLASAIERGDIKLEVLTLGERAQRFVRASEFFDFVEGKKAVSV